MATAVGVSVGIVDGRLQASMDMIRISGNNRLRRFIASPLLMSIILCRNRKDGNSA